MRVPSLYRRLWLAGAAMALFLNTLIVGNSFLKPDQAVRWNMLGYDFRTWYIAGTLAREGRSAEFYDLKSIERFDQQLARDYGLDLDQGIGPIFNPPFFAWIFAPLTRWPYPLALKIWYAISVGCLMLSVLFFGRILTGKSDDRRVRFSGRNRSDLQGLVAGKIPSAKADPTRNALVYRALIFTLLATSMPAVQALVHAQNTFLSLLMLSGVVMCWRTCRPLSAGLLAGLLFYKPQLGAVVAIALAATMGWRAALGLAISGLGLLLINLVTLPGSLTDFFVKMPVNLRWLQEEHIYAWQRHATFQGFWRTLLQWGQAGPATGAVRFLTFVSMLIVAIGFGRLMWMCFRCRVPWPRGEKASEMEATRPRGHALPSDKLMTTRNGGFDFKKPLAAWPWHPKYAFRSDVIDPFIAATLTAMPLLMPFYFDYDLLLLSIAAVLTAGDFLRHGRQPNHFADRWLPTAWFIFYSAMYLNLPIARLTHISPLAPSLVFLTALTFSRAATRLKNMGIGEPFSVPDDMIVSQCAA